jgi:hypothetical protein
MILNRKPSLRAWLFAFITGNYVNLVALPYTCLQLAMTKEQQIMNFLHTRVFDQILQSNAASEKLKAGVRLTIMRMEQRDAKGMVQYFWSAIIGTERSKGFAAQMKKEGFDRFEEALEEFREKFDQSFLFK